MLGKVAVVVKSKVALAVLAVALAGTGGTAALAATGHMPSLPAMPSATHSANSQGHDSNNSNHGHTIGIEGTLKSYSATAKTIGVQETGATSTTTITVNDGTRVNGDNATQLSDLAANLGHKVQVQAEKQSDGSLVAWKITVTGATGTSGQGQGSGSDNSHDIAGTITSVNGNGLVLKTANGDSVTVVINSQTTFAGMANALAKVKDGMRAEVHGTFQSDGSILADSVHVELSVPTPAQNGDNGGSH
jgi:Domain of unknown function (DUF5666)